MNISVFFNKRKDLLLGILISLLIGVPIFGYSIPVTLSIGVLVGMIVCEIQDRRKR